MARVFMRAGRGGYWVDEDTGEKFINENDPARLGQPAAPAPMVPGSPAPALPPPIEVKTPPQPAALTQTPGPGALTQAPPANPQTTGTPAPQGILASPLTDYFAGEQVKKDKELVQQGETDARRQALYSGLIGLGSGLLNYDARRGYGAALGQGLENFNKAYDTELVANRPKVTALADGAFSQVVFPDGTIKIMKNEEASKYLEQRDTRRAEYALGKQLTQGSIAGIQNTLKQNMETKQKIEDNLRSIGPQIQNYDQALKVVEQMKPGENLLNLPGVKQFAQATGFGGDTSAALTALSAVSVDEALMRTANTKGAISDKEMALFYSPIPKDYADPTVWKAWLQNRMTVLKKHEQNLKDQAAGLKTTMTQEEMRKEVFGPQGGSQAPSGGNIQQQASSAFGAYEPDKYDYRVNPDTGRVQRALKQ